MHGKIRVAVDGYGVIGKRVADAVRSRDDMTLVGVADVTTDWRTRVLQAKDIPQSAGMPDAFVTPSVRSPTARLWDSAQSKRRTLRWGSGPACSLGAAPEVVRCEIA